MPAVHFTNLLIVVAAGLLAPLALGFLPRLRIPAIVVEILLGIVIGPSGFRGVKADLPVAILALVGTLLRRGQTSSDACRRPPSPLMPVVTTEDRALSRVEDVASAA